MKYTLNERVSDNIVVRRMRLTLATKMARTMRNIFLGKKRTCNEYKYNATTFYF